ncbi:MAG: 3-methyl-2-oxobutanoate hydroxymethyltransferase [Muribaculaceae bacterium]
MSTNTVDNKKKVTTATLAAMKARGEKIAMITAYDYTMATLVDRGGIDMILVGDSAANVMAGYKTTLPITLDQMIYHASCVVRGVQRAFVVCDMPFGSYQGNPDHALASAVRILKESGAEAVKLEGGKEVLASVEAIVRAGIPVMGHLGLTPQSINQFGTYGVRAKEEAEAEKLISDALMIEKAGCFSLVLEKIPADLARRVTEAVKIPVIGIGAGPGTDGQVLVLQDMLGMNDGFAPKFLRRYASLGTAISDAIGAYVSDVRTSAFPSASECY